eukprot:351197-Chlamydomonas_euryale.AAC.2
MLRPRHAPPLACSPPWHAPPLCVAPRVSPATAPVRTADMGPRAWQCLRPPAGSRGSQGPLTTHRHLKAPHNPEREFGGGGGRGHSRSLSTRLHLHASEQSRHPNLSLSMHLEEGGGGTQGPSARGSIYTPQYMCGATAMLSTQSICRFKTNISIYPYVQLHMNA